MWCQRKRRIWNDRLAQLAVRRDCIRGGIESPRQAGEGGGVSAKLPVKTPVKTTMSRPKILIYNATSQQKVPMRNAGVRDTCLMHKLVRSEVKGTK